MAQDVARNQAAGQFTNLGVGLGTAAGVGGAIGGAVGGAVNQAFAGFGTPAAPAATATPVPDANDPLVVLGKLKQLLEAGLIEQAEYDAKKAEILGRM